MLKTFWTGTAIAALSFSAGLPAQPQKSQEELTAEREKKLAKPVFERADWIFDYDKAREEARRTGKVLFTYFSRSYSY
jgi:hypothetical protein